MELDDKHFINCKFIDCILEYHGREVGFDRTHMNGRRHVFNGRARRTLHYLQGVGLMQYSPSDWGELDIPFTSKCTPLALRIVFSELGRRPQEACLQGHRTVERRAHSE